MKAETIHRIWIRKKLRELGKGVEADNFFIESQDLDIDGIDAMAERFGFKVRWNKEAYGD